MDAVPKVADRGNQWMLSTKLLPQKKTVNALSRVAVTGVAVKENCECHKRQTVNAVTKWLSQIKH